MCPYQYSRTFAGSANKIWNSLSSSVKEEKRTSYETSEIHNTDDTVNFVIEGEDVIQDNEISQDTSTYYENEEGKIFIT